MLTNPADQQNTLRRSKASQAFLASCHLQTKVSLPRSQNVRDQKSGAIRRQNRGKRWSGTANQLRFCKWQQHKEASGCEKRASRERLFQGIHEEISGSHARESAELRSKSESKNTDYTLASGKACPHSLAALQLLFARCLSGVLSGTEQQKSPWHPPVRGCRDAACTRSAAKDCSTSDVTSRVGEGFAAPDRKQGGSTRAPRRGGRREVL